jgi:hypothetical protein
VHSGAVPKFQPADAYLRHGGALGWIEPTVYPRTRTQYESPDGERVSLRLCAASVCRKMLRSKRGEPFGTGIGRLARRKRLAGAVDVIGGLRAPMVEGNLPNPDMAGQCQERRFCTVRRSYTYRRSQWDGRRTRRGPQIVRGVGRRRAEVSLTLAVRPPGDAGAVEGARYVTGCVGPEFLQGRCTE